MKALERIRLARSRQPVSQLRSRTLWNESDLPILANRFAGFVPELPVSQLHSRTLWNESDLPILVNRFAGFVPELSGTNPTCQIASNWLADFVPELSCSKLANRFDKSIR